MKRLRLLVVALGLGLSACTSIGGPGFGSEYYSLIRVREAKVGDGSLAVTPPREWNRQRRLFFDAVRWVEDWTLNGPLLDNLSFVTGLPHGKYLIRTDSRTAQQVPRFDSDMTVPEITSLLESAYRVRGGAIEFRTLSLAPRQFLGRPGFQFDFEHLDGDELWRKGRAVGVVIEGELYLIMLDAARAHYFDETLPDFEAIVASARLR